ncbi:MAG: hypothetical protein GWO11_07275 [Desulfuromonadales bacterium]|nr:hypothetical protein [Desulfuromonadales bacterium]NIR34132.1 hypothetical protein [Desulfuromonadales bacterium]NIS40215.1 hypothetical protein [Desulfuromonadales bacterium]
MTDDLISARMHSCLEGEHHSGAERLCNEEDLEDVARQLLRRALGHERGQADKVFLSFDSVPPKALRTGRLPDLQTLVVDDFRQGRQAARQLLRAAGVSPRAALNAVEWLSRGAAPGGKNMRGAMLIDAESGRRRRWR